jgi:hypothetical protein
MLMGWSLQAPVSGLAAWVMVNIKRPFRIGDRVMLPSFGLIGDVTQLNMMYMVLNQVGGTVGSEEAAGRNILIPNAMLFGNIVINYTPEQTAAFVLDEVVIRITFNSSWDKAEKILITAAEEVTGDIIQQTGQKPYIRADMWDYGILMRLRYMTHAMDRPRLAYEITRKIFSEFQKYPDVDFAIPFIFSHRAGMQAGAWRLDTPREQGPQSIDSSLLDDVQGIGEHPDNATQVTSLVGKIEKLGLLQPIIAEKRPDGRYMVLTGHLRLAACRRLGWKTIPVTVRPADKEQ